jgi:hypothetical protein
MVSLEIFFDRRPVGLCHDVRLKMEPSDPINITSHDDMAPQFLPREPTWFVEAHDVQWNRAANPSHYATSSVPLTLFISEDGRPLMEGQAFIQGMRVESSPTIRLVYHIDFVGQGMLVRTDGLRPIIDRTPLDNDSLWKLSSNDREIATGFALRREDIKKALEQQGQIIYTPQSLNIHDNIIIAPDPRAEEGTATTDPADSDETPRGFRIVP